MNLEGRGEVGVAAHQPEYYRWTQWLFLKFFEAGHAYRKAAVVNWCPNDQTVLANEQVKDGRCERCGAEVEARKLDEWFFRITAYADELLDEMKDVEWPERVLAMQRNWIGRSEGAEILFRVDELDIDIPVFTTRPDTLFGATFFVLAPEHPLVDRLAEKSPNGDEIRDYARKAGARPAEERAAGTDKTGVLTGFFATNPVNDARIPVWVADYVLMDYGTGAIMAVPAHDQRDFEFARKYSLPVRVVVQAGLAFGLHPEAPVTADPLGDAAGRPDVGSLVSRNVIPSPRFQRSSWQVTQPNTAAQVMGRYYPTGSYMSRAQFEAKGCPFGQKHKG